jgi:D-alanine-D-alanine ligase
MRICLLTDQDLSSLPLPDDDWPCDPRPYLPDAEWTLGVLDGEHAVPRVVKLAGDGYDVFFNLCDAAWDEPGPGIEVVQTLESLGQAFTGADSGFFEPSREAMKRVCHAWDIGTPGYVIARDERDLERALDTLRFPLIVKHPSSYASLGLTRASRVETAETLGQQARTMMSRYGGALVEEFIEGMECTVLVAEDPEDPDNPTTYVPIRYRFPEGETFKHWDLKWEDYHWLHASPVEDAELDARLRAESARFFQGLGGVGYGRCDLRVDRGGRTFMLEINPNCGLYYPLEDPGSADLILQHDPAGHPGFTRQIVAAALRRQELRRTGWEVLPRPGGDYGLFATRDARPGDVLIRFEEGEHTLVSRAHVEASWGERELDWFRRYAWPLTDEVWVTWSRNPMEWMPVNHSCDPSAWIEGLDVVARRPLARGEEITLDYATMYNEQMPDFECSCGSAGCRGVIRGDDYRKPLVERYGEHVTDYVRRARAQVPGNGQDR